MRRAHAALDEARAAQDLAERAVTRALHLETSVDRAAAWDGLVTELAALAPGAFAPERDLASLTALADRAAAEASSWWGRWRARRAERRLRTSLGAGAATPIADLRTTLRCAADRRATPPSWPQATGRRWPRCWDHLLRADATVHAAAGRVAEVEAARDDRRRRGRAAAGARWPSALRAGRRQRRALLRQIDGPAVVGALPLWVGTLRDIEDLLPDTPGLFDLVILDEASQIDQVSAASALLPRSAGRRRRRPAPAPARVVRGRRPEAAATLAAHDLTGMAGTLDVRRASILDVASGATAVTWLDEHYRSVPHLIEFSARRFYDGRLTIATRHPRNEVTDVIDVVRTSPGPDAELAAALEVVRRLCADGRTDIALITPFRDLADKAQSEILAAYPVEEVERLRLRVGTVHAFQVRKPITPVLVLGVDRRPARAPSLRRGSTCSTCWSRGPRLSITVVTGLPPRDASPADALIEQYLVHADRPPRPGRWRAGIVALGLGARARAQRRRAVVRPGYPAGHWTVDLCVGDDDAAAVEAGVHPDGPQRTSPGIGCWRPRAGGSSTAIRAAGTATATGARSSWPWAPVPAGLPKS